MPIEWDLKKRVVIRQLGETATKNEIRQLFEEIGPINKLWVARNPPGFAFLEYKKRSHAETAERLLDGKRCCGCYIKVNLSWVNAETNLNTRTTRYSSRRKQSSSIDVDDKNDRSKRGERSSNDNISSSTSTSRLRHNSRKLYKYDQSNTTVNISNRSRSVEKQRLDCSICFHNLLKRDPTITPCMHVFCYSCIRKTLQTKKRCPLCQAVTLENLLKPIYLN